VNYRLLSRVFGTLLFIMAGAMAVGLAVAMFERQEAGRAARAAFLAGGVFTAAVGAFLFRTGRGGGNEVLRREAIVAVGGGWLLCAVFGAVPYVLAEPRLGPAQAFFESASGFTTTGSTVFGDLERLPQSLLFYRSLTQWLGGLGILALFVAVLAFLGVGGKAFMQHESSLSLGESTVVRAHDLAVHLWIVYIVLTVFCWFGLVALRMPPGEALHHAMTTISTGGFSPKNASIAHYDNVAVEGWLTLFMFLSSLGFFLYIFLWQTRWDRLLQEEETRWYLGWLLAGCGIVVTNLLVSGTVETFGQALRQTVFSLVSVASSTGFATADYEAWPNASRMVVLMFMIVGGCAGSTAGGLKVMRLALFTRIARQELVKVYRPNRVFPLRFNGTPMEESLRLQILFHFATFGFLALAGTFLVSVFEPGLSVEGCFGSVVTALSNCGPGFNEVGPVSNFSRIGGPAAAVLGLFMIMGRLEFFAVLVLFVPSLWRKY
jgi:trk system potassium uptake protein TrkH